MAVQKPKKEKTVMLNFALDTRSTSGKVTKAIYQWASHLGKLKNVPLYSLVEVSDYLNYSKGRYDEEKNNKQAEIAKHKQIMQDNDAVLQKLMKDLSDPAMGKIDREITKQDIAEFKRIEEHNKKGLKALEKELAVIDQKIERAKGIDKAAMEKQIEVIQKEIQSADKIIIIGHCGENEKSLSSDSKVETSIKSLMEILPNNLNNKHVDLVACQGVNFAKDFTSKLRDRMQLEGMDKNKTPDQKFTCDGMTLASRKHITIPIPTGGKLYFKQTKSGLPKIFKTGKDYRKDFLIEKVGKNAKVVEQTISNKQDKTAFQVQVEQYRKSAEVPSVGAAAAHSSSAKMLASMSGSTQLDANTSKAVKEMIDQSKKTIDPSLLEPNKSAHAAEKEAPKKHAEWGKDREMPPLPEPPARLKR